MKLKIGVIPNNIKIRLLLFNKINFICLVFLIIFMLMVCKMIPNLDLQKSKFTLDKTSIVTGKLIDRKFVTSGLFLKPKNKFPYKFSYSYELNGNQYHGESFDSYRDISNKVRIEYLKDEPELSRIEYMQTAPLPISSLFFVLFPAFIVILFVIYRIYNNSRLLRLLQSGFHLYYAKLISKQKISNFRVNHVDNIYKLLFQYVDINGIAHKKFSLSRKEGDISIAKEFEVFVNPHNDNESYLLFNYPYFFRDFIFKLILQYKSKYKRK